MVEKIKILISTILDLLGILNLLNNRVLKEKNSIRIINYHRTLDNELSTFEKQLKYFKDKYQNIDYLSFQSFKNNELKLDKQGLIITFDDGLSNNYDNAIGLLEKYGFTGYFFVSTGKVGTNEFMNYCELSDLIKRNHVIGCHTYSHHRMCEEDTEEILHKEIIEAKKILEENLNDKIDIFCWCGGEEDTYTSKAQKLVRDNYKYGFMTNNELVYSDTDNYHIQRTNIEARWPLPLVKFQLSGIMDYLYKDKRERVNTKTN